jgi:hypothetical protein
MSCEEIANMLTRWRVSDYLVRVNTDVYICEQLIYKRNNVHNEEHYILGYNAVQPAESQPTFRRIVSLPSFRSNNKPS